MDEGTVTERHTIVGTTPEDRDRPGEEMIHSTVITNMARKGPFTHQVPWHTLPLQGKTGGGMV